LRAAPWGKKIRGTESKKEGGGSGKKKANTGIEDHQASQFSGSSIKIALRENAREKKRGNAFKVTFLKRGRGGKAKAIKESSC